jgi:hypothetical protein
MDRLGPADAFSLGPLDAAAIEAFRSVLRALPVLRSDSLESACAQVAALAAAPSGGFGLTELVQISSQVGLLPPRTVRNLRYLLDRASFDETVLRRALVATAPMAEVEAFVLEYAAVPVDPERAWDVFMVVAIGRGWSQPIGIARTPVPPADPLDGGRVLDISEAEVACVAALLEQLDSDYAAVHGASSVQVPPVVARARSLGENPQAREAIGELMPEYFLPVTGELTECNLRRHPYESHSLLLREHFPPWPQGTAPPRPRQLLDRGSRHSAEYALAYRTPTETDTRFAICRPTVAAGADELLGERPERRARELAELAVRLPAPDATTLARVTDFRHRDDRGWIRSALLLFTLRAVLTGRLQPAAADTPTGVTSR